MARVRLTSQGVDGELIVRNLQSGQEYRHPRGTNPRFTADGKFVVFTIVQTKADEERQREQERRAGARGQARGGEKQGDAARTPVRTAAGIMTLATGQVTTVERVGSISLPEESSTWVALYRGNGGAGRGGGRGGRGGRAGGPRSLRRDAGSQHPRADPAPTPQGTTPAGRGRRRRAGTRGARGLDVRGPGARKRAAI